MYRRLLVLAVLLWGGLEVASAQVAGRAGLDAPGGGMQVRLASLCASLQVHVALPAAVSTARDAHGGCAVAASSGAATAASSMAPLAEAAVLPLPAALRGLLAKALDRLDACAGVTSFRLMLGTVQLRLDTALLRRRPG